MASRVNLTSIDSVVAKKLRDAGITTVEDLLKIRSNDSLIENVADKVRLQPIKIKRFASHADLMRVKGIGTEYSELLELSGVTSVPELACEKASRLLLRLDELNRRKHVVQNLVSENILETWIDSAFQLASQSDWDKSQYYWTKCRYLASDHWYAIEEVRSGILTSLLFFVGDYLELTNEQLSEMVQISERTLVRRKSEERLHPTESERLYRIVKLIDLAAKVFGDRQEARDWLKEPNFSLEENTPLSIAQSEPGAAVVERLLHQIEYGIAA